MVLFFAEIIGLGNTFTVIENDAEAQVFATELTL